MRSYGRFGIYVCAVAMTSALGCADEVDGTGSESGATVCSLVGTSSWWNQSFAEQRGRFHVELYATPSAANIDAVVGLSSTAATKWASLAAIVRFAPNGVIDARAGSEYRANVPMAYEAGTTYWIRIDVDVVSHTYSAWASTTAGEYNAFNQIARDFPFRTEQSTVTVLENISSFVNPETGAGTLRVCGINVNADATTGDGCLANDANNGFVSYAVAPGVNTMIVNAGARASIASMDGVFGVALGPVDAYNDLAASVRFWTNGYIEARDGDTYRADVALAYRPGVTYQFKFMIDLANKTYSVYVDDPATEEAAVVLALHYRFRPQQAAVATLDHVATVVASPTGHIDACDPRNVAEPALHYAREGTFWIAPTTNDGVVLSAPPNGTVRLDARGKVVASMTAGGQLATDTAGNIYVQTINSQYSHTITSYTPTFAPRWSRTIATNGYVNEIGVTSSGRVLVQAGTGVYWIAADGASDGFVYGWTQPGSDRAVIGRPGFLHSWWRPEGVVVTAFRPDGTTIWSRFFAGNFEVHALAMGPDGSAVIAGEFFADINFGDGTMYVGGGEDGPRNAYVVALDPAGQLRFSARAIGNDVDYVATNGQLIVTSNQNWTQSAWLTMQVFDVAGNHIHDWDGEGFGLGDNGNTYYVAMSDTGRIFADVFASPFTNGYFLALTP